MSTLPTVKVECAECLDGYMFVNESDFDASVHTRFGENSLTSGDQRMPPADPIAERVAIEHRGGGKYRVLVDGTPVPDPSPERQGDLLIEGKDAAEAERARQIDGLVQAAASTPAP